MPVERRHMRRLLILTLAIPVIVLAYLAAFGRSVWSMLRPGVATVLGATVIGSVYAEVAMSHSPVRATPLRGAAVMALAVTLLGASIAPAPTVAGQPAEAVIAAAERYIGTPYRLGAEGPNRVDCSGLVFRVFSDAGELPRVSGRRLRAVGYFRWFASRGLASKTDGKRGDLVIYNRGEHMGIYLGDGKVLSALTTGVKVHGLKAINQRFTAFLHVQWNKGDGTGGDGDGDGGGGDDNDNGGNNGGNNGGSGGNDGGNGGNGDGDNAGNAGNGGDGGNNGGGDSDVDGKNKPNRLPTGLATGTLNLRKAAGPDEKIVGWVSRGSQFKVLGTGHSPSGALWLNIEMANGNTGWIWSHWTRVNDR